MKKLLTTLSFILIVAFCFTSCQSDEEALKASIEGMNKELPKDMGNGLKLTKVTDSKTNLTFECSLDENSVPMEMFKMSLNNLSKDQLREGFISQFTNDELKLLVSLKRGIIYSFKGNTSGESADVTFTTDDIAKGIK